MTFTDSKAESAAQETPEERKVRIDQAKAMMVGMLKIAAKGGKDKAPKGFYKKKNPGERLPREKDIPKPGKR